MKNNNPKPEGARIKNLMTRIESGEIKIPKFQRDYVWKQKDIINLIDSIYRGYPIGSLLFWRTSYVLEGERNIGGYELPETLESYPTNYVLDGQQRITTIYSVLANRKNHVGMKDIFDISFELEQKIFVPSNQATPNSIPLHVLFDNKEFRSFTRELSDELGDKAAELQDIFLDYEVPVVTIFNMDMQEVSTIFERINSTGKKLTVFDLMVAATWSKSFDFRDEIKQLNNNLKAKNFGNLSGITLLKCLSTIMIGSQSKKAIFSLRDKNGEIQTGLEKTKFGLLRAIDFLSTELSISSDDFLPYDFQLVLLTYFFANVNLPTKDMIKAIKKWFWRSSFSGRYQGANDTLLEADLQDCRKLIENSEENIFDFNLDCSVNKIIKTQFKKGTAFSNAAIALMAAERPRNLITGLYINTSKSLSKFNNKEFHHVFPRGFLKNKELKYSPNSICNIVILSSAENKKLSKKAPSLYFNDIKTKLGSEYNDVLKSCLLPFDEHSGIFQDDFDFFIEYRAELLMERIKEVSGE